MNARDARLGAAAIALVSACRSPAEPSHDPPPPPVHDAGADPRGSDGGIAAAPGAGADAAIAPQGPWARLAGFPIAAAVRTMTLPSRTDIPRSDVGGPVIAGDVAVVGSSQLGFVAVDWRRGARAWTKPAGLHLAPPAARGDTAILIGDCVDPPAVRDALLGCLRVVAASGADESYAAIHGSRLDGFLAARGPQAVWLDGERTVRWRRGDHAVAIDLITGEAHAASAEPPGVRVAYRGHTWDVTRTEQHIVAHERGVLAWQTQRGYSRLVGAVYLADLAPMVRVLRLGSFAGLPELNLLDIDATGSLHGQASFPAPAVATLGDAIDGVGNTALAVRLDDSRHHDFIAAYGATAQLMYVYRLPDVPRGDPVGLAIAPDGVLAFHDGDTFTVLPELSSPPTAPGAPGVASQNSTP